MPIMKSPIDQEYEMLQDSQLGVMAIDNTNSSTIINSCFDVKMAAPSDVDNLSILVNGVEQQRLTLTGLYKRIDLPTKEGDILTLHTAQGHNLRLNNLGCNI
jgi:hypothetical protein